MRPGRKRRRLARSWGSALLAALAVGGCVSPVRRADLIAQQGGLATMTLAGAGFEHTAYARVVQDDADLVLFIEGDGSPWVHDGREVATDPTPRTPIALDLAVQTPGSVLYLGRPCYFSARLDPACGPRWWTSDRYSDAVVKSMAAAANRFIQDHHTQRVLVVGYSGGGTLAVLMAARVLHVAGVVSVAGNLDPDAWTHQHHYLPLSGSLNPASRAPLPADLPQWYLIGDRDVNVTRDMASRYLDRVPPDRIWRMGGFDHTCCWGPAWARLYERIVAERTAARSP
jgi:hypothetical protein